MIQYTDTEDLTCFRELARDGDVLRTGFHRSGRMIVNEDYGRSTVGNSIGKHLTRMNKTVIEQPNGDYPILNHLSSAIKSNAGEVFLFSRRKRGNERKHIFRRRDSEFFWFMEKVPTCQLETCGYLCGFRRP